MTDCARCGLEMRTSQQYRPAIGDKDTHMFMEQCIVALKTEIERLHTHAANVHKCSASQAHLNGEHELLADWYDNP